MSERTQRTLWTLLAVVAVGLAAATLYLYRASRTLSMATENAADRIAYMSFSETTGIPQLHTCDLQGGDVRPLVESRSGDVLPVCEPLQAAQAQAPRIAFVRFTSDPSSNTGTQVGAAGGVYVVSSAGGQEKKVSGNVPRLLVVAPAWSPDGKQLAFAGAEDLNGDGKYVGEEAGIYVCDIEGAQVRRMATVHATGARLLWSPASTQLILEVRQPDGSAPAVAHLLDLTTGNLVSRDESTTLGCWSPDGQYIAAYSTADRHIHILDTTRDEVWATDTPSADVLEDMFWLPPASASSEDRGRLLIVSAPQLHIGMDQLNLSSALTGDAVTWKQLTTKTADVVNLAPSPDGRWAVFTGMQREATGVEADLYLLNLAQGEPQQLTQDPGYEGWATWVPIRTK